MSKKNQDWQTIQNNKTQEENRKYFTETRFGIGTDKAGNQVITQSDKQDGLGGGSGKFLNAAYKRYNANSKEIEAKAGQLLKLMRENITQNIQSLDRSLAEKKAELQAGKSVNSSEILSPLSDMIVKQGVALNAITKRERSDSVHEPMPRPGKGTQQGLKKYSPVVNNVQKIIPAKEYFASTSLKVGFSQTAYGIQEGSAKGAENGDFINKKVAQYYQNKQDIEKTLKSKNTPNSLQDNIKRSNNKTDKTLEDIATRLQKKETIDMTKILPILDKALETQKHQKNTISKIPQHKKPSVGKLLKNKLNSSLEKLMRSKQDQVIKTTQSAKVQIPKSAPLEEKKDQAKSSNRSHTFDGMSSLFPKSKNEVKAVGIDLSKHMHHLGGSMFKPIPHPSATRQNNKQHEKGGKNPGRGG